MIVKNVRKTIEDYHMIAPREKVLAGVSGGADSVALLIVLHELSKEMDFDLEVVHIDHQIRGEESSGDADFVIKLAHSLGVNCHMIRVLSGGWSWDGRGSKTFALSEVCRNGKTGRRKDCPCTSHGG